MVRAAVLVVGAVQEVVVELDGRVGHLQPPDVDSVEEIIWEGGNFATINNEVIDLVAAESFDRRAQHLRILDIPAVGHHLHLLLALVDEGFEQQIVRRAAAAAAVVG